MREAENDFASANIMKETTLFSEEQLVSAVVEQKPAQKAPQKKQKRGRFFDNFKVNIGTFFDANSGNRHNIIYTRPKSTCITCYTAIWIYTTNTW